jgi:hypothetical protein
MLSELFSKFEDALARVAETKDAADIAGKAYTDAQTAQAEAMAKARELKAQIDAATIDSIGDARVRQS